MQGELGTSHAYEMGGDHRRPPPVALGFLGADLRRTADGAGYEIAEIVRGDPWDADADSPLSAIGVNARVGERIVAVNGQAVRRDLPPQALLVNQAGIDVGWGVENYGTDPDIDIDNAPQDAVAARDRQLEKALEVALRLAADVRRPSFGVRPNLARPPLPPRR
jgi:C-terminal processing protease CtpA/Prc